MARFLAFAGFFRCRRGSLTRYKQRMSKGFTLLELMVSCHDHRGAARVLGPAGARLMDCSKPQRAMRDVTRRLLMGRKAPSSNRRASVSRSLPIRCASIGRRAGMGAVVANAGRRAAASHSRPRIPVGDLRAYRDGMGASNTTVVLRRGSQTETITMSRVGRVKRW